jgi:8-oxo-dGTP diphosphatase
MVAESDLKFAHVMHRKAPPYYYIDFYFICKNWEGNPSICEPDICDEMDWFDVNNLPDNIIPEMKQGLENSLNGIYYSEFGWS